MQYTSKYKSPLGNILLAADEKGLTGLWFEGQKYLTLMIIGSLMLLMALYVFTFPSFKTEE